MKLLIIVIVLGLIAGTTLVGYHKGLLRMLVGAASLIIGFVFVYFFSGPVTDFVREHTSLYESVSHSVYEKVKSRAEADFAQTRQEQEESAAETFLPGVIVSAYNKKVTSEVTADEYQRGLAGYVAGISVRICGFLLTLIAALIVLRIIAKLTGIVSKIPIVGGINRLLGAALGLAKGLVVVALLFIFITMFSNLTFSQTILSAIKESGTLSFLYDNVMSVFGLL